MSDLPENNYPENDRALSSQRSAEEQVGLLRTLYNQALLSWRLFWDRRVSLLPKLLLIGFATVYWLSPVDLLSFVTVGPLAPLWPVDDIGVVMLALGAFNQIAPPDLVREHLRELGVPFPDRLRDDDFGGEYYGDDVVDSTAEVVDE